MASEATLIWIKSVVLRLSLCPWAGKHANNINIRVVEDEGMRKYSLEKSESLHDDCINIAIDFASCQDKNMSEFIVLPQLSKFENFLEFADTFNELLEASELDSMVQVATFHPNYQFADYAVDDTKNWSNRSPYPMLHLLKVAEVSDAIDAYGRPTDDIWEKNIETLRVVGNDKMALVMKKIHQQARK